MDCRTCDKYLFMYALGKLDAYVNTEVQRHLDGCPECARIAEALRLLIPGIYTEDDEYRHYCINIPERNTNYVALAIPFGEERAADNNAHLAGGGFMLALWFIAPAYSTLPITKDGRWLYGIVLGGLTGVFRLFGPSAENLCYAILLANLTVPVLEKITIRRPFGVEKGRL